MVPLYPRPFMARVYGAFANPAPGQCSQPHPEALMAELSPNYEQNPAINVNASQLSLTGIVFTRFSRRILLWFGFDAPWVTSFSAGG